MKDQVCEAKLDVWADLFHMFIGIVRDKPPAMSLVGNSCGQSLHLTRVIDIDLILRSQGQRCPDARVGKRPLTISIKGDLDLDSAFDNCRVTTSRPCALLDRW